MLVIKGHKCPRCNGSLVFDREEVFCLACSYRATIVLDNSVEPVLV